MPAMETNLDELLGVIARQTIILNRQDNAINEMTAAYNAKAAEADKLQTELTELKAQREFPREVEK
jgi:uncharacterized protein involved in exopolysaccharide biosynthesis